MTGEEFTATAARPGPRADTLVIAAAAEFVPVDERRVERTLERRTGHPLLIAAICAEVGRRAGLATGAVQAGDRVLVCVRAGDDEVAIDPTGTCAASRSVYAMHGRLGPAVRAARMRASLPVTGDVGERIEFESDALLARLN